MCACISAKSNIHTPAAQRSYRLLCFIRPKIGNIPASLKGVKENVSSAVAFAYDASPRASSHDQLGRRVDGATASDWSHLHASGRSTTASSNGRVPGPSSQSCPLEDNLSSTRRSANQSASAMAASTPASDGGPFKRFVESCVSKRPRTAPAEW